MYILVFQRETEEASFLVVSSFDELDFFRPSHQFRTFLSSALTPLPMQKLLFYNLLSFLGVIDRYERWYDGSHWLRGEYRRSHQPGEIRPPSLDRLFILME